MKINQKFDFVDGSFDTDTGKLECVKYSKYNRVDLCFKEGMNIPFAQIKLHSRDLSIDAQEVLEDANNLGEEIARRWNSYSELFKFALFMAKHEKGCAPSAGYFQEMIEKAEEALGILVQNTSEIDPLKYSF